MGETATVSVLNGAIPDPAIAFESSTPIEDIERTARAQLEHAFDGHRKGLKVYKSLASLNDVIGTQYGDRVLFELLQNAHDAHAVGERGEIVIRLVVGQDGAGMLLVANKGRSFSRSNLDAIRYIGTSDKEIGEGIGNKGLGFRSVEALTNDVHIYSAGPDIGDGVASQGDSRRGQKQSSPRAVPGTRVPQFFRGSARERYGMMTFTTFASRADTAVDSRRQSDRTKVILGAGPD